MHDLQPARIYGRKIVSSLEHRPVQNLRAFRPDLFTRLRAAVTRRYSYSYLLPHFNQGQFGSCVSNGVIGVVEAFYNKRHGGFAELSRRAVYAQAKYSYEPNDVLDDGLQTSDGLNVPLNFGGVLERDWQYPADGDTTSMFEPVPAPLWKSQYKIKGYYSVPNDIASICMAILKHGPQLAENEFPAAWEYPNGTGRLTPRTVASGAGHLWILSGFDLDFANMDGTKGMFELHNSWPDWGRNGTGFIPFSALGNVGWPTGVYSVQM